MPGQAPTSPTPHVEAGRNGAGLVRGCRTGMAGCHAIRLCKLCTRRAPQAAAPRCCCLPLSASAVLVSHAPPTPRLTLPTQPSPSTPTSPGQQPPKALPQPGRRCSQGGRRPGRCRRKAGHQVSIVGARRQRGRLPRKAQSGCGGWWRLGGWWGDGGGVGGEGRGGGGGSGTRRGHMATRTIRCCLSRAPTFPLPPLLNPKPQTPNPPYASILATPSGMVASRRATRPSGAPASRAAPANASAATGARRSPASAARPSQSRAAMHVLAWVQGGVDGSGWSRERGRHCRAAGRLRPRPLLAAPCPRPSHHSAWS